MVHLSTGSGCCCFMTPSQTHVQPTSPRRRMARRPHLDPFISCFQNDISLATEDQQARREQRSPVSLDQNNTGQEDTPRSRPAETDGPTVDPPQRHRGLLVRVKWTRGYLSGDRVFAEEPGRGLLSSWGLGLDHHHKPRLMTGPQCFLSVINPYEAADAPHVRIC